MTTDRPSEFETIARLFAPLATAPGAFGLTDDAAAIPVAAGEELVVTTDALVEGVHFLPDDPPETVARKALRVNLSDLAAKGATPVGYLLALSLPPQRDFSWLQAFARGLALDGAEFSLPLLGGDTTATPGPLTLAITAFGTVPPGTMIRRAGAQVGDSVFVSGTIGDAGGGLETLTRPEGFDATPFNVDLMSRYRVPTPRLALGQALRGLASAALDVSDGLMADLGHIADCSGVRIVVEAQDIPLSPALRALWGASEDAIRRAATAGDDYELAFTAASPEAVATLAEKIGVAVTKVGRCEAGKGINLVGKTGILSIGRAGYTHF